MDSGRFAKGEQSLRTVCDWRRIAASGTWAACKADAFGTSGHVTARYSIYNAGGDTGKGAFCKSGVYAWKDSCLTTGDLHGVSEQPGTEVRGVGSMPSAVRTNIGSASSLRSRPSQMLTVRFRPITKSDSGLPINDLSRHV